MYAYKYGKLFGETITEHFNPNIRLLGLNATDDHETSPSISLTELINNIKKNERNSRLQNWDLMFTMDCYPKVIYKLSCISGNYAIVPYENATVGAVFAAPKHTKSMVFHPRLSRELFKCASLTPEVEDYIKLLYGDRASKGFWLNMSDTEYENILRYEALYMLDLDSREKATHIVTNDLHHMRIPASVGGRRFVIMELARAAYPDIMPWQMKSMPRGYAMNEYVLYDAIQDTMDANNIVTVYQLTRKMLLINAPSVVNTLKSMAAIQELYTKFREEL